MWRNFSLDNSTYVFLMSRLTVEFMTVSIGTRTRNYEQLRTMSDRYRNRVTGKGFRQVAGRKLFRKLER